MPVWGLCPQGLRHPFTPGPALRWALWQPNPQDLGGQGLSHLPAHSLGSSSPLFTGYGKGVASGMKQVETNSYDIQRLLHVKGKRNVVAGEVGINQGSRAVPCASIHLPGRRGRKLRRVRGREGVGEEIDG